MTLELPPSPDEPSPYVVRVWRHYIDYDEPFVSLEDAVEYARARVDGDDCWVEGIFRDGEHLPEMDRRFKTWMLE